MANKDDDMVIVPRGPKKQSEKRVRERATEKRRTRRAKKKRTSYLKKLRGAVAAKSGLRAARSRVTKTRKGFKAKGKGIGKAGWFSIITTAIDVGAEARAKVGNGMSQRLYAEHQRRMSLGYELSVEAQARNKVRAEFEADPDILRMIGIDGGVSNQLNEMRRTMQGLEYDRIIKHDHLSLSPQMDSYDGMKELVFHAMMDDGRRAKMEQVAKEIKKLAGEWTGYLSSDRKR